MPKKFLLLIITIFLVISAYLYAAGEQEEQSGEEEITLQVWMQTAHSHQASQPDVSAAAKATMERFEKEHPNITIEWSLLGKKNVLQEKLFTSAQAGVKPDVTQMRSEWEPALVELDWITPIDQHVTDAERQDFYDSLLQAESVNGKLYALPFYVGINTYYYRKSHLQEVEASVPKNWDELIELGEKLQKNDKYGFGFAGEAGPYSFANLLTFIWSAGAEVIDDAGAPVFFEGKNAEALKQVYTFLADIVNTHQVAPEDVLTLNDRTMQPLIFSGELSTWVANQGMLGLYRSADPKIAEDIGVGFYPIPKNGEQAAFINQWSIGMCTEDEKRQEASMAFIRAFTSPEHLGMYAPGYYSLVARESAIEHLPDSLSNDDIYISLQNQLDKGGHPAPRAPYLTTLQQVLTQGISEIILGNKSAEEIIESAKEAVLEEYNE